MTKNKSYLISDGGYEGASWQVLDIDTYWTDIEAYTDQNDPPQYELLYSARQVIVIYANSYNNFAPISMWIVGSWNG